MMSDECGMMSDEAGGGSGRMNKFTENSRTQLKRGMNDEETSKTQ